MFHLLIFTSVLLHSSTCNGLGFSSSSNSLIPQKISGSAGRWNKIRISFLEQFRKDRSDNHGMGDAVLSGLTKGIRQILDSEMQLFSIEDIYPQFNVYLCTNFGNVGDMKTITKVDKNKYVKNEDGSFDVTAFYDLKDFKISYGTFNFQTPVNTVTGNITLSVQVNRILIEMRLLSLKEAIRAILDQTTESGCLLYVKNFQWEALDQIQATIHSDSTLDVMGSLSAVVTRLIAKHNDVMVKTMQKQVLMELYNKLPKKPLCKHQSLIKKAAEYEANKKREFSSDFKSRCGARWVETPSSTMVCVQNVLSSFYPF